MPPEDRVKQLKELQVSKGAVLLKAEKRREELMAELDALDDRIAELETMLRDMAEEQTAIEASLQARTNLLRTQRDARRQGYTPQQQAAADAALKDPALEELAEARDKAIAEAAEAHQEAHDEFMELANAP